MAEEEQSTPAPVSMTSEQLKARLDEERHKGRAAILKELGYEKVSDAQVVLKAAKEREAAEMTERERLAKELEELKPRAAQYDAMATQLSALVEEQFNALPESVRNAIDEEAQGSAGERMRLMKLMRAAGVLTGKAADVPSTRAPAGRPPSPASQLTKYEEYQQRKQKFGPMAAAIFYSANRFEIERTAPET